MSWYFLARYQLAAVAVLGRLFLGERLAGRFHFGPPALDAATQSGSNRVPAFAARNCQASSAGQLLL